MKKILFLLALVFLAACSESADLTGGAVNNADSDAPTAQELESTDCNEVIKVLEKELNLLIEEKEDLESQLVKEIRKKDDEINNELIDEISERLKMVRKGLIPTLESSIEDKKSVCK